MLKLSASLAICRNSGPVIAPRRILVRTQIDHGFYREDMALLHNTLGLILVVVGYIGS